MQKSICFINVIVAVLLLYWTASEQLNIAKDKETKQSSLYENWEQWISGHAVDGNKETTPHLGTKCSHTMYNRSQWWAVHFGQEYIIDYVKIYSDGYRPQNFFIHLYDQTMTPWEDLNDDSSGVLCYNHTGGRFVVLQLNCKVEMKTLYLKIQLKDSKALVLCEVEVYTRVTEVQRQEERYCKQLGKPNVAEFKQTMKLSPIQCAVLYKQTDGCLYFDASMDGSCSLIQADWNDRDSNKTGMFYYQRC